MPHVESTPASPSIDNKVRRLVLCFDGTGNDFQGNTSDTNVVKIYDKLDRNVENQYHYYQPGIGTYDISGGSVNKGMIGGFKSKITRAIDAGIATSFDAHVMAGYKFLMNYHEPGAKIYMFGFSRGAFTARFLARMINTVGLLSKGNDEMVAFAYALYQEYEQAKDLTPKEAKDKERKLTNFTSTFCREDKVFHPGEDEACYGPIKVYFLGIFDCVSSVAVLETPFGKTPKPVSVVGTAEHVRHAVAADEFRVKFKAALLNQDQINETYPKDEDVKEVWFPGNHGDVGGGWPAHKLEETKVTRKLWQKIAYGIKSFFVGDKNKEAENVEDNAYQMSDIPLSWMIHELQLIGAKDEAYALKWGKNLAFFKEHFNREEALKAVAHNTMAFGQGSSWLKVLMWKFMDYVPLFPRYELDQKDSNEWKLQTWPPNMASARDIPKSALLHESLRHRLLDKEQDYKPTNNHGFGPPCLDTTKFIKIDGENSGEIDAEDALAGYENPDHTLYALNPKAAADYKASIAAIAGIKEQKFKQAHSHSEVNGTKSSSVTVRVQEVSH